MFKKRLVVVITSLIVLLGIGIMIAYQNEPFTKAQEVKKEDGKSSKNLIVLIGDGMGPAQITMSRLYGQLYMDMERLTMDDYLVGTNSTFADETPELNQSGIVTDSAASGTAFATGNKTYNGAISVTNEEVAKPVASVLEAAKNAGKSTGLISTARITHATPAVYAAHVRSRANENAIATQYVNFGLDVILGGGERHFVSEESQAKFGKAARQDGRNLVDELKEEGYKVVYDRPALLQANGDKLVGFFSDTHIPYNLDRDKERVPSLKEQFEAAVKVLGKNDKGFVLMLEAGRIDHAGHANDLHSIAQETIEFDEAFRAAIEFAKKDGNTSVIATADHETGGLSIGSQNVYDAYFDVIQKVNASSEVIGKALKEAKTSQEVRTIVEKYTTITDLTDEEVDLIMSGHLLDGSKSSYGREGSFNAIMAKRSFFGWTGHGHSGVDVGVYGYGPAAELLRGFTDNTDFAKAGALALNLDLEATTAKLQEKYLYPKFLLTRDNKVMLPVEPLAEVLDFTVEQTEQSYLLKGANQEVAVSIHAQLAKIDDENVAVQVEQDGLYVPIEVIQQVTTQSIEWDALSERIILN